MPNRIMTEAPDKVLGQTLLATKTGRTVSKIEARRPCRCQDLQAVCSGRLGLTERRLGFFIRPYESTDGLLWP